MTGFDLSNVYQESLYGEAGPQGDPGAAGGAILAAFWQYASQTVAPPGSGTMRTNSPITQLWISETDTDGFVRTVGLGQVAVGSQVLVRAANGTSMDLLVTGTPTDNGTYWTFPVSVTSGSVNKGARTQINFVVATGMIPPGGTTGQVLAKNSNTDYDVEWITP